MLTHIPHGDYPNNMSFNYTQFLPELFADMDSNDFCEGLAGKFDDFLDSAIFLMASLHQINDGAKLVMLLSAIERIMHGSWRSLESELSTKGFKKNIQNAPTGQAAYEILSQVIEKYSENFGSVKAVVEFYSANLSLEEKFTLIDGITHVRDYFRHPGTYMGQKATFFEPNHVEKIDVRGNPVLVDEELANRMRYVIYEIRSKFVHQAYYYPYPNEEQLKEKKTASYERHDDVGLKQEWVITLPFEKWHEITRRGFIRFWKKTSTLGSR